ncbi:MAG: carboxypeptidase-like regulatory domain-containing protein [Tannerella sp.]|jgi:TonB-dependent SusC/RagA subfamily outer membrane receptor|nr:carboxypeptidase-like regulatory domain-containing protein [Tannerella sp.]
MENFMIYLLKTSIWIAVFWGIYRLFLRNELFFRFNRVFLLSGLVLSFVLALCRFTYPVNIDIQPVSVLLNIQPAYTEPVAQPFAWKEAVSVGLYVLGIVFLAVYHLLGLYRIRKMIRKNSRHIDSHIIDVQGIQSSFSLFGYVFTDVRSMTSDMEKNLILEHEQAHIEQKHWIDVALAQIVCTLLWFNPFAWLYLAAVKLNHEYLADRFVLGNGHSRAVYNAALINNTFKTPIFTLTNSFSYNKLKRITMMKKSNSNPTRKWAVLIILPALAVFMTAFAKPVYHYSSIQAVKTEIVAEEQDSEKVLDAEKMENLEDMAIAVYSSDDSTKVKKTIQFIEPLVYVKGKVLDKDGKPIEGAIAYTKGSKTPAVSDADGNFSIEIRSGQVLYVAATGKEFVKMKINGNKDSNPTFKLGDDKNPPPPPRLISEQIVKGKLLDSDGKAIAGANIVIEGTTTGTISDTDGNFAINVPKGGATLAISFIGKETQRVKIGAAGTAKDGFITIYLDDEKESKESSVKVHRSGANSDTMSFYADTLSFSVATGKNGETPLAILDDKEVTIGNIKLNGNVVIISTTNKSDKFHIAQNNFGYALGEKAPLIVVDGKETSETIDKLNPNDIESFEVLKKEAAINLYGEKAKNGAVLITTKKKKFDELLNIKTNDGTKPLYILDGKEIPDMGKLNPIDIESISILKDKTAIALYGEKAKRGVVLITTKKKKLDEAVNVKTNDGTRPLYIVDGKETTEINKINVGDIEDITVLKDASAVSLYGEKATNGVVIITTKKK